MNAMKDGTMQALKRNTFVSLAVAGLLLSGTTGALAKGSLVLNDRQLDRLTAGGTAIVLGSSDAQAAGVLALTDTANTSVVVGEDSPWPNQPNLGASAGAVEGVAVAFGSNFNREGKPPASSDTAVTTVGRATGDMGINFNFNHTIQGPGGVSVTIGLTAVFGTWGGL